MTPSDHPGEADGDLSFERLTDELPRLAWLRLSFALVRIALAQRLGREPAVSEIWAEYTVRHPGAARVARAAIAAGLVACPNAAGDSRPGPDEPPLDEMELVPGWWRRLDEIRLSLAR